jgi:phospholipid/cholesterol/gamma-HCH transport system permease protein
MAYVETRRDAAGLDLALSGAWRGANYAPIAAELAAVPLEGAQHLRIDASGATVLDTAAAWQLQQFIAAAGQHGARVEFAGDTPDALRLIETSLREGEDARPAPAPAHEQNPVELIGRTAVERWQDVLAGLSFVGRVSVTQLRAFTSLRRLRPISIARHVYDTGITALPIVALIAFLMSIIIAYLGAQQLRAFGAEIFVVDLVTVGVLRELGVLLTAIIIAGRSGSAFAAEIGAMQLNEEVDALRATGVDPVETLVLPRIIGLVIALPLLAMVSDVIGLLGGAMLCHTLLDMPISQYIQRVNEAIAPTTFWVGIVKAPVFAAVIALSGTYRGMQVRDSSRELGRLTTVAVVQSIFLVLLVDAVFAILFMEMDI